MKKFLAAVLGIFLAGSSIAAAEQPKAQEYREILSSGNFYVEYDDQNVKRIVAEVNGCRMERTDLSGKYKALVSVLNPIGAMFASRNNKHPDFMYDGGRYYKFIEGDQAIMAEESQLNDVNLNPSEGWSVINRQLSLPDELAVFNWHDKYHKVSPAIAEPVFAESLTKNVDGKNYECDRYESAVANASGGKEATIVFDLCYEKGELAVIQSAIFANGREYGVNKLIIKKIQREIPGGAINPDNGAKVYAAGIGDMNDLLENPVLIGKLKEVRGS